MTSKFLNASSSKFIIAVLFVFGFQACQDGIAEDSSTKKPKTIEPITVTYPKTYMDTTIRDTFLGISVPDPYRWLEFLDSRAADSWVSAQQRIAIQFLDSINSGTDTQNELKAHWDYQRFEKAKMVDNYVYYFRNEGLQNHDILYRQQGIQGLPEQVIPPTILTSSANYEVLDYSISKEGQYLALKLRAPDSSWEIIKVKDLRDNTYLEDEILWVNQSNIAWAGNGFFYSRYPKGQNQTDETSIGAFHAVYYHQIGTDQSQDQFIFADRSKPEGIFKSLTSSDERFLLLFSEYEGLNSVFARDLSLNDPLFTPLVVDETARFDFVDNVGNNLLFVTNFGADRQRLIQINNHQPDQDFWETILPEQKALLKEAKLVGGRILTHYLENAHSQGVIYNLDGEAEGELALPQMGTIKGLSGTKSDSIAFFTFESFTQPPVLYQLDMNQLSTKIFKEVNAKIPAADFETKLEWVKSFDLEKIPVFITYKKGIEFEGQHPTLLLGAGGANRIATPEYQPFLCYFLEKGGVIAVANLRGSGVFGKAWHQAGLKKRKQTSLDDFQMVAEYLITQNITKKDKLVIYGQGVDAMVAGGSIVQRPDLFKVAILEGGPYDILGLDRFENNLLWEGEFGELDGGQAFDYLNAYSPYQNVTRGHYPAVLMLSHPSNAYSNAHSNKFTAALQEKQLADLPILLLNDRSTSANHRISLQERIKYEADQFNFVFYNMNRGTSN